eukprot:687167-Pelagomonas_calceolata.AAC.1
MFAYTSLAMKSSAATQEQYRTEGTAAAQRMAESDRCWWLELEGGLQRMHFIITCDAYFKSCQGLLLDGPLLNRKRKVLRSSLLDACTKKRKEGRRTRLQAFRRVADNPPEPWPQATHCSFRLSPIPRMSPLFNC